MRIYVSGGMTGWPNYNREAFEEAAEYLRSKGHVVITPLDFDEEQGVDLETEDGFKMQDEEYEQVLGRDLNFISRDNLDALVFVRGWKTSGGAGREGRRAIEQDLMLFLFNGPTKGLWTLSPAQFLHNTRTERLRPEEERVA